MALPSARVQGRPAAGHAVSKAEATHRAFPFPGPELSPRTEPVGPPERPPRVRTPWSVPLALGKQEEPSSPTNKFPLPCPEPGCRVRGASPAQTEWAARARRPRQGVPGARSVQEGGREGGGAEGRAHLVEAGVAQHGAAALGGVAAAGGLHGGRCGRRGGGGDAAAAPALSECRRPRGEGRARAGVGGEGGEGGERSGGDGRGGERRGAAAAGGAGGPGVPSGRPALPPGETLSHGGRRERRGARRRPPETLPAPRGPSAASAALTARTGGRLRGGVSQGEH